MCLVNSTTATVPLFAIQMEESQEEEMEDVLTFLISEKTKN